MTADELQVRGRIHTEALGLEFQSTRARLMHARGEIFAPGLAERHAAVRA